MKVEKILVAIRMANGDHEAWARIARDLGHELPRNRLDVLREFRVKTSRLLSGLGEKEQCSLRTMVDLVAAYEVAIEAKAQAERMVVMVRGGELDPVLRQLARGPMRHSEIVSLLKLAQERAVEIFIRALALELVYSSGDLDDPLYRTTSMGEEVAHHLTD